MAQPLLYVEGLDDMHTVIHLIMRHGMDFDSNPRPVDIKCTGGKDELLDTIEWAVPLAAGNTVGFVIDADSPISDRWKAVRERFHRVDVKTTAKPLAAGFIGVSEKYQTTVGIWLMPDNKRSGDLEHFIRDLIEAGDPLIGYAGRVVKTAVSKGSKCPTVHRRKAEIHSWLAWQEEPGRPYGTAITARYFGADNQAALAFVAWFKKLYGINEAS